MESLFFLTFSWCWVTSKFSCVLNFTTICRESPSHHFLKVYILYSFQMNLLPLHILNNLESAGFFLYLFLYNSRHLNTSQWCLHHAKCFFSPKYTIRQTLFALWNWQEKCHLCFQQKTPPVSFKLHANRQALTAPFADGALRPFPWGVVGEGG